MKTTSPNKAIALLSFLLMLIAPLYSRAQLLDSLALDSVPAFTSIEEALLHPDDVIKLELRKKKLHVFPPEIFKFKNLQYLDLSKNDLKEIPAGIASLKNLQYLSVAKNNLETLPPEIGDLENLFYLNANNNNLASIPAQLGKLQKLRNMDLWSNNIEVFPDELKYMKALRILDLRVILIPDAEQERLEAMLPHAKIYFSPYCKCSQ